MRERESWGYSKPKLSSVYGCFNTATIESRWGYGSTQWFTFRIYTDALLKSVNSLLF